MKDQGASIKFNKIMNTYYYQTKYSMYITVKIEKLENEELKNISAGISIFSNNFINTFF